LAISIWQLSSEGLVANVPTVISGTREASSRLKIQNYVRSLAAEFLRWLVNQTLQRPWTASMPLGVLGNSPATWPEDAAQADPEETACCGHMPTPSPYEFEPLAATDYLDGRQDV